MKKLLVSMMVCLVLVLAVTFPSFASGDILPDEDPTSGDSMIDDPTSGEPINDDPTSGDPINDDPTSGDPMIDDPTSGDPVIDDPTSGDPVIDDPTSGDSMIDDPTSGDPMIDDPTSGDPMIDDPTSGDPIIDDPTSGEPSSSGESGGTSGGGSSHDSRIKVSFRLIGASPSSQNVDLSKGKQGYYGSKYQEWVSKKSYRLEEGASVKDLIEKVLADKKLDCDLKDTGYGPYVAMIESPRKYGSHEISEFGNGQYSGWMFTVNGDSPWTGISDTILSNGDDVLLYYTNDFRYEMEGYGAWYGITEYDGEFINAWLNVSKSSSSSSGTTVKSEEVNTTETQREETHSGEKDLAEVDLKYVRNAIMSKDSILSRMMGLFLEESTSFVMKDTAQVLHQTVTEPTVASVGGEWAVMGIKASSIEVPEEYFETYYQQVEKTLKENDGVLSDRKYTEYARVSLALSAIEKDATNVGGVNLLSPLTDYDKVTFQGMNGAIYALLALDQNHYETDIREQYLAYILARQGQDGGFSFAENGASDVDVTAMALQALSHDLENETVRASVNRAVEFLSRTQRITGGYESFGLENLESTVQVYAAMKALHISMYDSRFVKNGNTIMDAILSYYVPQEGFKHVLTDEKVNLMATEQALYVLTMMPYHVLAH